MSHPLDRPVWNMLNGAQAALAVERSAAVRIDPRYGPFAAARDRSDEAQAALGAVVGRWGEAWLAEAEAWPAPPGTRVLRAAELVQMVADEPAPVESGDEIVEQLGEGDAEAMTALALATSRARGPLGPTATDPFSASVTASASLRWPASGCGRPKDGGK